LGLCEGVGWYAGRFVTNACRLFGPCWGGDSGRTVRGRRRSPMPVGCSVPVGSDGRTVLDVPGRWSPMPVGCSVPVGIASDAAYGQDRCKSPMPVGCSVPVGKTESPETEKPENEVTNACRLFGPCWVMFPRRYKAINHKCHQCLSAVRSLLGSRILGGSVLISPVTNACRLFGPCWAG